MSTLSWLHVKDVIVNDVMAPCIDDIATRMDVIATRMDDIVNDDIVTCMDDIVVLVTMTSLFW